MIRLSNRLQTVVDFVSFNSIVADIGTDHGLIPVYLILNDIVKKVIATDISESSLKKTVLLAQQYKMNDRIECRVGNGLTIIRPYEVDTVIIAGMGGVLMSEILSDSRLVSDSVLSFILQPMTADAELRNYLFNEGFVIQDEKLSYDSEKYYHTMLVSKGVQCTKYDNCYVSPFWEKNDLLVSYLNHSIRKQDTIIHGLERASVLNEIRFQEEVDKRAVYMKALASIQ